MKLVKAIIAAALAFGCIADAQAVLKKEQTVASQGRKTQKKRSQTQKTAAKKPSSGRRKATADKTETSAEVRRRQQAAQQEIKKTKAEIAANDKAVKTGLADLGRISAEIEVSRRQVADMSAQVSSLNGRIGSLQTEINSGEKELARMRQKYLEAVKKMRLKKGRRSTLALIFASESFSQAMRRMRWLRQFSDWRDNQSELIARKVGQLKTQTQLLAQTKNDKNRALQGQMTAQRNLEKQHAQQDVVVAGLRKNGEALRAHLAKKQAEANDLRNRVAALIAQEQAAAEARRREEERREQARREEQARQERLQAEAEAKAKAQEAAEAKKDRNEQLAEASRPQQEKPKKEKKPGKEKTSNADKPRKSSGGDYAEARKRRPRSNAGKASEPEKTVPKVQKAEKAVPGGFEAAKGSLPRPVSGAFRVTSPFGRHPLPDLPDVMYDNPGIDAEVSQGASAQAVYSGRVSGVYMLPGYNTVVIVNHGGYYTIYGNIASAAVKVGDTVKQGQALGKLAGDPDLPGHSSIHFEVWKNREKLNPMSWIR